MCERAKHGGQRFLLDVNAGPRSADKLTHTRTHTRDSRSLVELDAPLSDLGLQTIMK